MRVRMFRQSNGRTLRTPRKSLIIEVEPRHHTLNGPATSICVTSNHDTTDNGNTRQPQQKDEYPYSFWIVTSGGIMFI